MAATSRALVLEEPRRLVMRELPLPEIGDADGLLRVEACGLCGTDHEQFTGALPGPGPFVPGHEAVGVVDRLGRDAAERWGVAEGDRVAVQVFQRCGECDRCRRGDTLRCRRHGLHTSYGFVGVAEEPGLWGGYAQYQYLAPDTVLHRIPDGLDPVVATAFNPLGAGIRWGVTVPGTGGGDVVAVLGPGIRGLSVAAAAREAGAGFVMVTGKGAHDAPRLEAARRFGADLVVDVDEADPVAELRRAAGGLARVVVDVTAKAPAAFAQAVQLARPGGTVVVAGTRGAPGAPGFDPDTVVYRELRIVGAFGVDEPAYAAAIELLAAGRYPFDTLAREVAGLDGAADLLRTMAGEGGRPPPVHGVLAPEREP